MIVNRIDFSHERDLQVDELIRRAEAYIPNFNAEVLRKACDFAQNSHSGQLRSSGEKYFVHPMNVAATLLKLRMDLESVVAGLLHDVIEDCHVKPEEIEKEFGPGIAQIVVGLTKISKIEFKTSEESQAENFRKMVVAMAKDLRVIIVKLADRMHNMRTLQYVSEEKQKKKAQETLDIYVPLASRLGINSVKSELEDLCLRFLKPEVYYRLAEKVAMKKSERDRYIEEVIGVIKEKLLEYSLNAYVRGRPKHFYSIYKKMVSRSVDFEQIQDILAFRLIVNNITECYKALGIIHSSFTPIPGRFKDYIAIPKANNYQSLHTTVIGPKAERIEIQIRTQEMDDVAERGVAAHWKYKEGFSNNKGQKLAWVEDLLEYNRSTASGKELLDVVKTDLDMGGIFVFTPKGEVLELCLGATPLDFAYMVHTEVGHHCVGAKINGKIVPLRYKLKSGDTIEIITSRSQTPSKDWLNIVKTTRAKTKIRQWMLKIERDQAKDAGRELLEKAFRVFSTSIKTLEKNGDFANAIKKLNFSGDDELFIAVGSGKLTPKNVIENISSLNQIKGEEIDGQIEELNSMSPQLSQGIKKRSGKENAVVVEGMDDLMIRMARCCNPILGDQIVGYVTRGRGITVHTTNCNRIDSCEIARSVKVSWNSEYKFKYPVNIKIMTHDKPGLLSQISGVINNLHINIKSAMARSLPDCKANFIFEVEVKDYKEFQKTVSAIESLEEVISVERA